MAVGESASLWGGERAMTVDDVDPALILDLLSEPVNRYRVSDHVITYCNAAWAAQYGVDQSAVIGRCLDEFLSLDERDGLRSQLALLGPDRPVVIDDTARAVPGGEGRWLEWVDRYVATSSGPQVLSVGRDVTDRRMAEVRLRESEARFRGLADNASDVVWRIRTAPTAHFEYVSPSVERILGYPPSYFLDDFDRILDIAEGETQELMLRLLRDEGGAPDRFDLRFRHANGSIVVGETTATFDLTGVHGVVRDVTTLRRLQAATMAQACRDSLTGIGNRRRFDQLIGSELERTSADGTPLAVAFLDVDGLKGINDRFGHEAGDTVLKETARRLKRAAAGVGSEQLVARLGGDEFAIIFEPAGTAADQLLMQIDKVMRPPITISDLDSVRCELSAGVASTAFAGRRASDLLAAADRAMYHAKRGKQAADRRSAQDLLSQP